MSGPFENIQQIRHAGTGNISGTLDATLDNTGALATGTWMVWATQPFQMQINAASGTAMGAAPGTWPANYPVVVTIPHGSTQYLGIVRLSADGAYYANRISLTV